MPFHLYGRGSVWMQWGKRWMYIPSLLKGHCQVKDLILPFVTNHLFAMKRIWSFLYSFLPSPLSGQPSVRPATVALLLLQPTSCSHTRAQRSPRCTGCLSLSLFFIVSMGIQLCCGAQSFYKDKQLFVLLHYRARLSTWRCPFKSLLRIKRGAPCIPSEPVCWVSASLHQDEAKS